ncbi:extracellular solute-binding protein [Nocardioides sp.]|uniref:extracellular solute-binding protein n=1 Tax=Nocardioides sp. TaxID=35761 RepID=UPI0026221056|nr:extracellular solute-binding protein [Nocardioides sp.]
MLKQVVAVAGVLVLAGCGTSTSSTKATPTPTPSPTGVTTPAKLTLGVWGNSAEVRAWGTAVANYNAGTDLASVNLTSWSSDAAMMTAINDPKTTLPDVFLISRADLSKLEAGKKVEPVDDYLDARNVDIGDKYSRDALEALSKDQRLECMPYGVNPSVVYYNTDLVDFPRMQAQGIDVPNIRTSKSWTWEQFQLAAQQAATHDGVKPFAIDSTLTALAPFFLSAGGTLADVTKYEMTLGNDQGVEALDKVLPVLANPSVTTTASADQQLRWFKNGKLAMMVGDRSLVPALRAVSGLRWDVLPMPTIDDATTTGDYTALCLSAKSEHIEAAADLLVGLSSQEGVKPLAATGYLVPVNQQVALTEDFLQTDQAPLHSSVFTYTVRKMAILPFTEQWSAIEEATRSAVDRLFVPGQIPVAVQQAAEEVDAAAAPLLAQASIAANPTPTATP